MNKIDEMSSFHPRVDKDYAGNTYRVWLSAHTGEGDRFALSSFI